MKNFSRTYRLEAGPAGQIGFQIGETTGASGMPLHVSFAIEKSDVDTDNTGRCTIWNLNAEHIDMLNRPDCIVSLRAGYDDVMPLIFSGVVTYVATAADGADMATEVELTDSRIEVRDAVISVSFAGKVNSKKILQHIADAMGVTLSIGWDATFRDVRNFAFVGSGKKAVSKICDINGLAFSIQNGILQVKTPGSTMSREVFLLSPDTGLIGTPKRITIAATDTTPAQHGWEVEYLMNAAISIDDYVRLESKSVQGYFRASKIAIEGDSHSGVWQCTGTLLEV